MRGFNAAPTMPEKLISCASYLTMGLVGFIWLIILAFQRATVKEFLKYHILQSIFISIIIFIFKYILNVIFNIAASIPGVKVIVDLVAGILNFPVNLFVVQYPLFSLMITILVLYCAITSLMGKYSYFPWISDNIKQML